MGLYSSCRLTTSELFAIVINMSEAYDMFVSIGHVIDCAKKIFFTKESLSLYNE